MLQWDERGGFGIWHVTQTGRGWLKGNVGCGGGGSNSSSSGGSSGGGGGVPAVGVAGRGGGGGMGGGVNAGKQTGWVRVWLSHM